MLNTSSALHIKQKKFKLPSYDILFSLPGAAFVAKKENDMICGSLSLLFCVHSLNNVQKFLLQALIGLTNESVEVQAGDLYPSVCLKLCINFVLCKYHKPKNCSFL